MCGLLAVVLLLAPFAGCGRVELSGESVDASSLEVSTSEAALTDVTTEADARPGDAASDASDSADEGPDVDASITDSTFSADADGGSLDVGVAEADAGDADGDEPSSLPCPAIISESWTFTLTDDSLPWHRAFGDPSVDPGTSQLVLTFDDVVRRGGLPAGYYFGFDLDLEGDIIFLLEAPGSLLLHPSIGRSGNEITLAGDHYASDHPVAVGAFTGQKFANTPMRVTFFAKAGTREVALEVVAHQTTYRSGFVGVGMDVSEIQMIGNNTPASGDGPARVGKLTGCAALTDDNVERAYTDTARRDM
jgi:hypothetical protein